MLAQISDALILDYGHYGDGGKPMMRSDGSVIEYVVVYDPESRENLTLTLSPDLSLDKRQPAMTRVDLTCELRVQRKAGHTGDGRAYVGASVPKLTVSAMAPAQVAANGKPRSAGDPVKA